MLIKGKNRTSKSSIQVLPFVLIGILLVLLLIKFDIPSAVFKKQKRVENYTCSAEKVEGDFFVSKGVKYLGGITQSEELARTGKYSSKLDSAHLYGIGIELESFEARATYKADVWVNLPTGGKAYLVVSAKDPKQYYQRVEQTVERGVDGWRRIECIFTIPDKPIKLLSVYTHKGAGAYSVYFDDFSVIRIDTIQSLDFSVFQPLNVEFQVSDKNIEKLKTVKTRYLKQGLIIQEDEDWVKAKLKSEDGDSKAKIRYKGDWLDHLRGNKESFRVEIKSDNSWNGLQTFSIQAPEVRGFLNEWVFHEFLREVDVLTPRYDFINVAFNGNKPRVYAYEEHFTKNLVESQLRREGPIVKFTEDRYWNEMNRNINIRRQISTTEDKNNAYWYSQLKPFKEGKTTKNPTLSNAFEIAQNLLHQYKYGLKAPDEVFDLDLMAKYFAILDITEASHSLTWHNQRFYYNPVTSLLEPIGFDGYSGAGNYWSDRELHAERIYTQINEEFEPLRSLFYDAKFVELYLEYLKQYSDPNYIKRFLAQIEETLNHREIFIQKEYGGYKYDKQGLINRSLKIAANIKPYPNSLRVFKKQTNGDSMIIQIQNSHVLPLEIVAVGNQKTDPKSGNLSVMVFPEAKEQLPNYTEFKVLKSATHVYYRLPSSDEYFTVKLPNWTAPKSWSPRQELLASISNKGDSTIYEEQGDLILFSKKTYAIQSPLVLPKGKKVIIAAGCVFKFSKGGFLLSFSAVEMRGDPEEPIIFESTDNESGALIVMQAAQKSLCRHVIFRNQNTLSYKGWNLTGAVTFYESDVKMQACQFVNNNCEDALNIVRSDFEVDKCAFVGIFGDAFDADFCKGTVQNSTFDNVGNDALDFSTSQINIQNCKMNIIGDKAISAGEQATISATGIDVNNANIGFASKDKSVLTLSRITLKNTKTGFTAYQKKPEYGPATINLKNYSLTNVKYPYVIEDKSILKKE